MVEKNNTTRSSDERLELLFRHAGLSEKQAKLYRILINEGEQKAAVVARKSGIKRSNAYALLKDLKLRGLVTEFDKGKIAYYRPEPPAKILDLVEARKKDAGLAEELARDMVPQLTSQYKIAVNRPVVRLMEGKDGMENIMFDIYGPKSGDNCVWGCVDIEKVHFEFPEKLKKELIPLRKKHQWTAKSIFVDNKGGQNLKANDADEFRESGLVDGNKYPLPAEIDVYDDKITFLSFESGEFMGLVIENHVFAETLRSIFKLAFEKSRNDCSQ